MKKLSILIAAISAVIASAKAEMLYWQVDEANYASTQGTSSLWYENGDNLTQLATANLPDLGAFDTAGTYGTQLTQEGYDWNAASAVYWVEVTSYDSTLGQNVTNHFGGFSYADLANAAGGLSAAAMRAANTNMSHSGRVPEPTSGLMMIVGMALLGLKRRRV